MGDLQKALSAGICTILVGFITQWNSVTHTKTLVHPDWDSTVDADARLWSIIAVIVLYTIISRYTRHTLTRIVLMLALTSAVLIGTCYYFSSIISNIAKVEDCQPSYSDVEMVFHRIERRSGEHSGSVWALDRGRATSPIGPLV